MNEPRILRMCRENRDAVLAVRWRIACGVLVLYAVSATGGLPQTLTTLLSFDGSNGAFPTSIVQGRDGRLWGTTNGGSCGTAFNMTVAGALDTISNFDCKQGNEPEGVILGTGGEFYGVTFLGGENNKGTVFRLTQRGHLTPLVNFFGGSDGSGPIGTLTQGTHLTLYGTTYGGGSAFGYGTVYKITVGGKLTTLYDFDYTHGAQPYAGLVQGADGDFYGTTYAGGASGGGTVFKITPNGTLTVLYEFVAGASSGFSPITSLVEGTDGNFYGTAINGGAANDGTLFSITPTGLFTSLHAFVGADGRGPAGALVQGTDGNLYGTTAYGGANDMGTIFKITPSGTLTTLHSFDGTDGAGPFYLVQDTNGKFYGLTSGGGTANEGTVFSLDVGLGPFVEAVMNSEIMGTTVQLLGQGLTETTAVSFNGTPANFTVRSDTYLTATVPSGATTGFITVTTTSGTLKSYRTFVVDPG